MLIVCPSCASAYEIEAGKVGLEGRSVRCASCRETWFISPADVLAGHEAELTAEAPADPEVESAWEEASAAVRQASDMPIPARPRPAFPSRKDRRSLSLSPSLACGLALLAALPLLCLARTSVVRAVPPTAALFARIGLPVNLRGIEIRDMVAFSSPPEEGRPAELVVEGDLLSVARADVPVMPLIAEIRDTGGRVIRTFPVSAPRAVLGHAETARFRGVLPGPPTDGRTVVLRFAEVGSPRGPSKVGSGEHE